MQADDQVVNGHPMCELFGDVDHDCTDPVYGTHVRRRPSIPLDESSEKISECFEIAGTWEQPRFLPAAGPADTPPCPHPSPRANGS